MNSYVFNNIFCICDDIRMYVPVYIDRLALSVMVTYL